MVSCFAAIGVAAPARAGVPQAAIGVAAPAPAATSQDEERKLQWQADFRLRFESDWDSRRAVGIKRLDRDRLRIRARFGLTFAPTSMLSFGTRVRTGSRRSQQSPHITIVDFDGFPTFDHEVLLDKWYARVVGERFSVWGGKNSYPFWKQDEFFWDDDVTLAGGAGSYKTPWKGWDFTLTVGYFALPDGGVGFNGRLGAGQLALSTTAGPVAFTAAGGVFFFDGAPGAEHLRRGNGARDYTLWVGNLQAKWQAWGQPVTLGLDVMHNSENYSPTDPDPFTAANHDQRNGYVSLVTVGQLSRKGAWLIGYYYAHIETLAVHASYAQDDWVRWGSPTQTDSSDLKGHEIRLAYAPLANANLVARLYLVEAITSVQDGKRFRLDFNYTF